MKKMIPQTILLILTASLLIGCAKDYSADSYSDEGVGQAQSVDYGVIIKVQPVKINGNSGVGGIAGGATGAVAGGYASGGNLLFAIGGGIIGAIAGNAADKSLSSQTGIRYFVRLEQGDMMEDINYQETGRRSGQVISIVQGTKPPLTVGQRVLVLNGGTARARLLPDDSSNTAAPANNK